MLTLHRALKKFDVSDLELHFKYNPKTGNLIRIKKTIVHGKDTTGKSPGYLEKNGYLRIRFRNTNLMSHGIAWCLFYKKHPTKMIDHINGIKTDNRIKNLREVSHRENMSNTKRSRSGEMTGVCFNKNRNHWTSYININKQRIHLGCFKIKKDAHNAYLNKLKEITKE